MKKILILFILLFTIHFATKCSAQDVSSTRHKNFDDDWKFHFGNSSDPLKDFNYSIAVIFSKTGNADGTAIDPDFIDSSWRSLNLPHDWAVELPFVESANSDVEAHGYKPVGGLFPETSIGWYRKHFQVAAKDSGMRFQVQFDGIFRDANIWINGFFAGNNKSGYVGATYDITDYINYGDDNVIVVRVDASQYEGWFYEGAGIYRHAWLNTVNNVHIANEGAFIYTDVQDTTATVNIETPVHNQGLSSANVTVSSLIADREGRILQTTAQQPVYLNVNETKTSKQKLLLNNPHLWSVEDPYLYRVTTSLKLNGKTINTNTRRFGIRTITINENGLFVNGKYVKIKGVCDHQDHAGVGSALPDQLQYYRIQLLKEMGVNAYRTSHNAPTPELLDACDSLGILVLDEQRLLNSSPEYIGQFERLMLRDRSHPSVFMWSIGNEEGYAQTLSTGKRIAQTLVAKQREIDPSRLSTYASDVANIFQGVNEIVPVRGFNYRITGVDAYHKDYPLQPIIGTEMGSTVTTRGIYIKDTIKAYVPDEDITAPWWANTAEQWWTLAAARKWWMGGFVWTGFDYRGEPTPFEWPDINSHFGIMDMCGFPKNIYYYYQSWWTDKDVLHISPHWNWPGKEAKPIDVWVNSNADNVELFLNGKSLGKKNMLRNRHLQWSVKYQPGVLSAIAYKNKKKITAKVETTGTAATLVLTPNKKIMLADGMDAVVLNVTVMDKQGREVPDAGNLVHFTIAGDAKIIGVGNGDPSSHEPDKYVDNNWQRALFNGRCQLIIQAGKTKGTIHIEALSNGLSKASTVIDLKTAP